GLTDGELVSDGEGGIDWAASSALPPGLAGVLPGEPRWIDLRWARGEADLTLRNPRFRDAVGELAAPLHGRPKDELLGEDVRQHRRTVRIARGGVAALTLLAAASTAAAVVAVHQRDTARVARAR